MKTARVGRLGVALLLLLGAAALFGSFLLSRKTPPSLQNPPPIAKSVSFHGAPAALQQHDDVTKHLKKVFPRRDLVTKAVFILPVGAAALPVQSSSKDTVLSLHPPELEKPPQASDKSDASPVNQSEEAAITATPHNAITPPLNQSVTQSVASSALAFNTSMLAGFSENNIDLSRFEKGMQVPPGLYNVDIYLNQHWKGRTNVHFVAVPPNDIAKACFTSAIVEQLGISDELSKSATALLKKAAACITFQDLIPEASSHFDMSQLRLDVSIPQAIMGDVPRGYVNPASWDEGVTAFRLNYRFNGYHQKTNSQRQTSSFLRLESGFNVGRWRFRQTSNLNWRSAVGNRSSEHHWQSIEAFAKRAIPSIKSELTLGDSHTGGSVFNSFSLRGVQLATDSRMYPRSRRGYAPTIRGVAQTNAKVTIYQQGVLLYQTTVPPGAFVIDDLYPGGYGGDLHVVVTEANGQKRSFDVPYAAVPQLMRPGTTKFSLAVGQLRTSPFDSDPEIAQGVVQHGFTNLLTGYTGFQLMEGYSAVLAGAAFNTHFGALSADITQSRARLAGQGDKVGQSVRLKWSKQLPSMGTSFNLAAYRYSTEGFLGLTEALTAQAYAERGLNSFKNQAGALPSFNNQPAIGQLAVRGLLHQRSRFTLSMNQQFGPKYGTLFASASYHDYWNQSGHDATFSFGYSKQLGPVSVGLSAARTRDVTGRYNNRIGISLNLPLGHSGNAPTLLLDVQHNESSGTRERAMLSGSLGKYSQFSYGGSVSHSGYDDNTAAAVHASYRGSKAIVSASHGRGHDYLQTAVGVSGSVVVHSGGITLGQPTGETFGIVHADGAQGAALTSSPGVQVDSQGYAIVPYLAPYQLDTVSLDARDMSLGVQLSSSSINVAPYAGAMVQLDFRTQYGRAVLVEIRQENRLAIPFGAEVFDEAGERVGAVGQNGIALLRVKHPAGTLTVHWKHATSCAFRYELPINQSTKNNRQNTSLQAISVTCKGGQNKPVKQGEL